VKYGKIVPVVNQNTVVMLEGLEVHLPMLCNLVSKYRLVATFTLHTTSIAVRETYLSGGGREERNHFPYRV
jgi:hypothetical protein